MGTLKVSIKSVQSIKMKFFQYDMFYDDLELLRIKLKHKNFKTKIHINLIDKDKAYEMAKQYVNFNK